jgi:queuosine precursor transporter
VNPEPTGGTYSGYLVAIAAAFVTALVVSNIIAVKLTEAGSHVLDAGNILFPLAYLLGDVLTEVYGFRTARRVILLGFACNLLAVGAIQLAIALPAADFWQPNQEAYSSVLGTSLRLFGASLAAYLVGELSNSFVLARLKVATAGRFLWTRTISSSVVGQGLDSSIFVLLAFAGTGAPLVETIVTTWVAKVAWEIAATPLTYLVVNGLKRREGLDPFDRDLRLSPRALLRNA